MRSPGTLALIAALALALLSCGGGGSPSDADFPVDLSISLHNAVNAPTILRANLAFDGEPDEDDRDGGLTEARAQADRGELIPHEEAKRILGVR
jgi:hypothetical protein